MSDHATSAHRHLEAARTALRELANDHEKAYNERNLLAAAFAVFAHYEAGIPAGIARPKPSAEDNRWRTIWVDHPVFGQMTWTVERGLAEDIPLEEKPYHYDGHDNEEKNLRLLQTMQDYFGEMP